MTNSIVHPWAKLCICCCIFSLKIVHGSHVITQQWIILERYALRRSSKLYVHADKRLQNSWKNCWPFLLSLCICFVTGIFLIKNNGGTSLVKKQMAIKVKYSHLGLDRVSVVLQTTFSNAFSWQKDIFWFKFYRNVFPWVWFIISTSWFRWWLVNDKSLLLETILSQFIELYMLYGEISLRPSGT